MSSTGHSQSTITSTSHHFMMSDILTNNYNREIRNLNTNYNNDPGGKDGKNINNSNKYEIGIPITTSVFNSANTSNSFDFCSNNNNLQNNNRSVENHSNSYQHQQQHHHHHHHNSNDRSQEDSGNDNLDDASEMTDYQRSFSEGRLLGSGFNREALSQSHDSVFSESATASSLSIVLKAELFDVLRKRRNRPDASDEDLGLPQSPTTPQHKDQTINNQSELSSLSLLSMASSDLDDETSSINYVGGGGGGGGSSSTSGVNRYGSDSGSLVNRLDNSCGCSSITSTSVATDRTISSLSLSQNTSKTSDELDLGVPAISSTQRLSHSAARHKMAIRPKKKGPTRYRKQIENTNTLPTTHEVNEELHKISSMDVRDSCKPMGDDLHQFSPEINTQNFEDHNNVEIKKEISAKRSAINDSNSVKNICKTLISEEANDYNSCNSSNSTLERKDDGFFRRLLHRNSNKKIKKQESNNDYNHQHKHELEHIMTETQQTQDQQYKENVEETRREIRKEILSEAKTSLSTMLNSFILSSSSSSATAIDIEKHESDNDVKKFEHESQSNTLYNKYNQFHQNNNNKPKSGPAARQRILPKDLSSSPLPDIRNNPEKSPILNQKNIRLEDLSQKRLRLRNSSSSLSPEEFHNESPRKYFKYSSEKINASDNFEQTSSEELLGSTKILKTSMKNLQINNSDSNQYEHHMDNFQQKIIGLSPYQHKLLKTEITPLNNNLSSLSLSSSSNRHHHHHHHHNHKNATTELIPKQRKSVEKSKSFRYYSENLDSNSNLNNLKKRENMPSLPDLSYSSRKKILDHNCHEESSTDYSTIISPSFEINDNNLLKNNNDQKFYQKHYQQNDQDENDENDVDQQNKKKTQDHHYHQKLPLSQGIYTKNIILTTSKPTNIGDGGNDEKSVIDSTSSPSLCNKNIYEIEENIDKIVKSPFVTILRKPITLTNDNSDEKRNKPAGTERKPFESDVKRTSSEIVSIETMTDNENNNQNLQKQQQQQQEKTDQEVKVNDSINKSVDIIQVTNSYKENLNNFNNYKINSDIKAVSTEHLNKQHNKAMDPLERKSIIMNNKYESTETLLKKIELRDKDKKLLLISSSSNSSNNNKMRRNSSVLEKFDNNNTIPEFMKIQLNRVDHGRPKSNVILSKNIKESEEKDLTRRFSNESIEISDSKPPMSPSLNSFENSTMKPVSSISLISTSSLSSSATVAGTTTSQSPRHSIATSTITSINQIGLKNFGFKNNTSSEEENITQQQDQHQKQQQQQLPFKIQSNQKFYERKSSVTDEKSKYEKKIEELKLEWKKPSTLLAANNNNNNENTYNYQQLIEQKTPVDEENSVVLRKKSIISNNINSNKEDTPELIKVFARRSLKIKDEDMHLFDDIGKINNSNNNNNNNNNTLKKLSKNIDSDKENQSSSEEKLDKLPKVEITIQQHQQQQQQHHHQQQSHQKHDNIIDDCSDLISNKDKNRNSTSLNDLLRKLNNNISASTSSMGTLPTKPFNSPMRYSNIVGKISTTKSVIATTGSSSSTIITTSTNADNNNNNRNISSIDEFKGILQRRAEWEKRAKEALK